jgi:hypothetical protein
MRVLEGKKECLLNEEHMNFQKDYKTKKEFMYQHCQSTPQTHHMKATLPDLALTRL